MPNKHNGAKSHSNDNAHRNTSSSVNITKDADGLTVIQFKKAVIPARTGDKETDLSNALKDFAQSLRKNNKLFNTPKPQ